jgi:Mg-chelatase subunit ChlD
VIPLFAFLFVLIIAAAAFTVDIAYMHCVKTELQIAADAAARAASNSLGSSQDLTLASDAAKHIAGENFVAGSPLTLVDDDIIFGQSTANDDGTFSFVESTNPINAVRIRGSRARVSASGPVRLVLGPLLGREHFEPEVFASAARVDRDIVIVVDRSGSMAWDESGTDWSYPEEYAQNSQSVNYGLPPHPTGSRWAGLIEAVSVFCDAVDSTREEEHLALVSYSDRYTYNGYTVPTVATNAELGPTSAVIVQELQEIGENAIIGGTNISAGLDRGVSVIQNPDTARPFAFKMVILMTDGVWNAGRDPVLAAQDAAAAGIVVHAITFSAGANQADMQEVAEATGGKFYHAPTRDELKDAFEEIAYSIPVILIE